METFDIQLGPLGFAAPLDAVGETPGDGLEVVGSALTASDRKPRPFKLKLPVRGPDGSATQSEDGLRLRRQVRALFDNARWRLQGFYFVWDEDPDLDAWLLVGGGELTETDPGLTFGEFELDLTDVYVVGRPGTHRPGRRATVGDRRGGLVARDTRGLLFSTDFSSQALPTQPLFLPGDITDLATTGVDPAVTVGPLRGTRRLWRRIAASDGAVVSYRPDAARVPTRRRYLDVEDLGSVRAWDLSAATTYPPEPADYSPDGDTAPDTYYGWERAFGDVVSPDRPLAIDNGICRLIWLGAAPDEGLAVEYWDPVNAQFRRRLRALHAIDVQEQRLVEVTPERVVAEWRAGSAALRAILQRGWTGPRLEAYDDTGAEASIEFAAGDPLEAVLTGPDATPTWIDSIEFQEATAVKSLYANSGSAYTVQAPAHGEVRLNLNLTANCALSLAGGTSGEACSVQLHLVQDPTGGRTVTWPSNIDWGGSGAPVLASTAGQTDRVYLTTDDGGVSWFGSLIGNGYTSPTNPDAPTSLAADSPTVGEADLTWTQANNHGSTILQNNIYRGTTSGGEVLVATIAAGTSYTDTDLPTGTYYYKVSAVNAIGEGPKSSEVSVVVGQVTVASDNFNRADATATSPTTGLIGQSTPVGSKTWLNFAGVGFWNVASNKATCGSAVGRAGIDAGVHDCTVQADIDPGASLSESGLVLCWVDANNFIKLMLDPGGSPVDYYLQKRVANVDINVNHATGTETGSRTVKVVISGSTYDVYVNGAFKFSGTISDSVFAAATKHGLLSGNTSNTFDNFSVKTP